MTKRFGFSSKTVTVCPDVKPLLYLIPLVRVSVRKNASGSIGFSIWRTAIPLSGKICTKFAVLIERSGSRTATVSSSPSAAVVVTRI